MEYGEKVKEVCEKIRVDFTAEIKPQCLNGRLYRASKCIIQSLLRTSRLKFGVNQVDGQYNISKGTLKLKPNPSKSTFINSKIDLSFSNQKGWPMKKFKQIHIEFDKKGQPIGK